MSDDDDGPPQLSAATLAALLSVRAESEAAAAEAISHALSGAVENKMPEDWGLAQFWTSPAASAALAGDLLAVATDLHASGREHVVVAFLSAPSAFQALLARPPPPWLTLKLLEFDTRFACFGDAFVHWNCVAPLTLPPSLLGGVDVFLIDPPRLNATTLADYASAISALARSPAPPPVAVCSGAVLRGEVAALWGAREVEGFVVDHPSGLANDFSLFTTYPSTLGRHVPE